MKYLVPAHRVATARRAALLFAASVSAILCASPAVAVGGCDLDQTLCSHEKSYVAQPKSARTTAKEAAKLPCLGGQRCRDDTLEKALSAAKHEWEESKRTRTPTIDVYPIPGRAAIPIGNARVDFPVVVRYRGEHANDRYVPILSGGCIDVIGENGDYPLVSFENIELLSCVRVEYARLTLRNVWVRARGANAISVIAGSLDAVGLALIGQGSGVGVSLTSGASAQFTGLLASGYDTAVYSEGVSFGFCGDKKDNRIWDVKVGLSVVAPPDALYRHQNPSKDVGAPCRAGSAGFGFVSIQGRGTGTDSAGIVFGSGVPVDKLTVSGVDVSHSNRAVVSWAPPSRIQDSTFWNNATVLRFGNADRDLLGARVPSNTVIAGNSFLSNGVDLETSSAVSVQGTRLQNCVITEPDPKRAKQIGDVLARACLKVSVGRPTGGEAHAWPAGKGEGQS